MFFKSHQKEIQSQLADYRAKVAQAIDAFEQTLDQHFDTPDREILQENLHKVHQAEHLADNIRETLEVQMHSQSVFPEARGDIMELLELMDKVPNHAESAVRMILEQYIDIPEMYHTRLRELVHLCRQAVETMLDAVDKLFTDYTAAAAAAGRVDQIESDGDTVEGDLIEAIFSSDLDGYQKLLLKDLVKHIARIADRAEDASRHIEVMVAKRSL